MSSTAFDQIAASADHLAINPVQGRYHKPLALVWAIDRAMRGLPRLATAASSRSHLDPLFKELTGVDSNAAWPWLELANDLGPAWVVGGADTSADPPLDFVAGWSRSAHVEINANPTEARQPIEFTFDRYLDDVRDTVAEELASAETEGLHRWAREWVRSHLNLAELERDDRLWDGQGRSYIVEGRTGSETRFSTSFDLRRDHETFDFLVPVVLDPGGRVIRAALVEREAFDRFATKTSTLSDSGSADRVLRSTPSSGPSVREEQRVSGGAFEMGA